MDSPAAAVLDASRGMQPLTTSSAGPWSDRGEPASVIETVNENKISLTPVLSQLEQDLNSPSHLRITINTEDKKIEIEQVKVILVYKGRGEPELDSTEESSFKTQLPQITEFTIKNVTVDGVEDKKEGVTDRFPKNKETVTDRFPKNKETDDKNVKDFEAGVAFDVSNILDKSQVEKRSDADDKEKMKHQNEDAKESEADDAEEILMREIGNLSINENDNNLEEISSLDGIILPTEEDKELFNAPSLLLVFDYGLGDWIVKEFGEIIILYQRGNKYQLQFRRYHNDGYETSLTMTLTDSFKLHQMRYSRSHAWEWTFHYITEGGPGAFRTLAAKFLSRQVAYEFYNKIKECVLTLKSRGDALEANLEAGLLSRSQSIRLISRTPTPTFGPGTVLRSKSADICERPAHRIGSYWISPISSKSRKIRRNSSNNETGSTPEDYRLKRTRPCITPLFNDQSNSAEDTKVSLVYKCHACGLCFDRPEILLDIHLSKCSPDMKIVKTKCACGLVFDQYNFTHHCQVHRQYTALDVKKIVVRDEKNLDVSGMKEVFMEEMGDYETTGEDSVRNDQSNETIAMNKCEMEAKVANKKVTTNVLAVRKAHRVFVCQCRLCFDRAEFFVKHLSKCSLETKVVKTTCICDLVFDKYNFAYHCAVHRQATMLNVKYIVVRDEGILDISGMIQEFVEDDEINVTENIKAAFMKTVDQSLVFNPVPKYNITQNVDEEKINNHEIICTTEEYNNAEKEDKAKYVIAENQNTLHEIHSSNEEIIGSQENNTDRSQAVSSNALKEVIVSTKSMNKEHFEVHDELTKKNDADMGPSHIDKKVGKTILTTEEQQHRNSDTDVIEPEKKISYITEKTPAEDENLENITNENKHEEKITHDQIVTTAVNTIDHSPDTEGKEIVNSIINAQKINVTINNSIDNKDTKQLIEENKTNEIQEPFNNAVKEIKVTIETDDEKICNIPNNSESNNEDINERVILNSEKDPESISLMTDVSNPSTMEEKPQCHSDSDPINSGKKTDYKVEQILVKDGKHENENITKEKKNEETTVHLQKETDISSDSKTEHDPKSKEIETPDLTQNSQYIKEAIQIPDGNKLMKGEAINISIIEEKPQCHSDSDTINYGKKTDNTVEQILVRDDKNVNNITKENKKEETTVDLQKETDISSESKVEHDPKSKENETPDLTQNSQYIKEAIQIPDGNKLMKGEAINISIIEEKPQCHSDSDTINYGKKTDNTVEQILVRDDKNVNNITKENKKEETTVDLQKETDISSESKVEHDPKSKENETPDLTQNSQYIKEAIQIPDGNKLMKGEAINISIIEEKPQCHSDSDTINSSKKTDNTVEQILVRDDKNVNNITKENKKEETTVDLQKETDISSESKVEHDPKSKENETPDLTQNSQYIKEAIQVPDGNKLMKGEAINISIIEEKPQCHSDSDTINSGKKTDNTVEQILVRDDKNVNNITKENKKEETTVDLQKETDISSESKVEHDPKSKENETPDLTQNSQYIKEAIQIPDGNEKNVSQNDDISNAQENETSEINVTVETCNVEKSKLPDKMESKEEVNTSDVTNNQKDSNLLKPTTDKKIKDNISNIIKEVPDKKGGDIINVKNNKKENPASNATNSNQKKSGKQGRSNANSSSNSNKRSKGKK
ncbi:uncharacterized protein [Choristoneura fumiferana]|uniref:uncharacterized protein n=1 Tax=Choristoneura fumiferana TaxID=7141 RepID=UPI003D15D678